MTCCAERERRVFRALSVFAGGFGLAAVAAVCCGGDQAAALDLVDLLAGKSLVVAEPAAGGTRYRLLETIRQYAAERLAEAGEAEQARERHAAAFLALAERERELAVLLREQDNFRAALDHALAGGDLAGPRLARALGGFWLARGLFQEGRAWLERALATGPRRSRAARRPAPAARGGAVRGRRPGAGPGHPGPGLAGRRGGRRCPRCRPGSGSCWQKSRLMQDGTYAEALEECEAAAALLESDGRPGGPGRGVADGRQGCASALVTPVGAEAGARARRGIRAAKRQPPRGAGVPNLAGSDLPGPAHPGRRGGRPRRAAARSGRRRPVGRGSDTPPLSLLYGYAGRFADARAAYRRSQSEFTGSGAKLDWAMSRDSRPAGPS